MSDVDFDVDFLRDYKSRLHVSTPELASLIGINDRIMRLMLAGETDRLFRFEDGTLLTYEQRQALIMAELSINPRGACISPRPRRRDCRKMAKGWTKSPGGMLGARAF